MARGYPIERENYLEDLRKRGEKPTENGHEKIDPAAQENGHEKIDTAPQENGHEKINTAPQENGNCRLSPPPKQNGHDEAKRGEKRKSDPSSSPCKKPRHSG